MQQKNFMIIACNVLWREYCHYAALSGNRFSFRFLEYGLHGEPARLRLELQKAIDATPAAYDAILLGYGLCSKGVEGIVARKTRLAIIRGHDCITCLLGSKSRYHELFAANPGTYWYSPGWIENHVPPGRERYEQTYREYLGKYGEDNAKYLMEMEQDWFRKYSLAAYVDLGVGDGESCADYTRKCADWLGWKFKRIKGNPALLQRFLAGDWNDEEILVVEPGGRIEASNDESIIRSANKACAHE